jgi:hypothetical protein
MADTHNTQHKTNLESLDVTLTNAESDLRLDKDAEALGQEAAEELGVL